MSLSYFSPAAAAFILVWFLAVGACVGSFVYCAFERSSEGRDFIGGRSECRYCGRKLSPRDLVPVLSYIFLRGKCRYCGEKIGAGSFAAEAVFGAAYLIIAAACGLSLAALENIVLFTLLLSASVSDLRTLTVPDILLTSPFAAVMTFWAIAPPTDIAGRLAFSLIFGAAIYLCDLLTGKVLGQPALGEADIACFVLGGMMLGAKKSLLMLFLCSVFGLAEAAVLRIGRRKPFAFVPAITAAALIAALFGDAITDRVFIIYQNFGGW